MFLLKCQYVALFFRSCQSEHQYSSDIEDLLNEKQGIEKLVDAEKLRAVFV